MSYSNVVSKKSKGYSASSDSLSKNSKSFPSVSVVQQAADEELQMKSDTTQFAGKEDELQMKTDAVQFAGKEGELQMKSDTTQFAGKEDELQMKTDAVQFAGKEEELQMKSDTTQFAGKEDELQMKSDTTQFAGKEDELQMKTDAVQFAGKEDELQMKSATAQLASAEEEIQKKEAPIQRKENKTGMPDNLKSGVENLSGMDMGDVKVHYNSSQPAQLNALAYAQGNDIHIGPGQEKHLPHEAWHVVQQRQGRVQATKQMKMGVAVNDDPGLEHEADVMGAKALQQQPSLTQLKFTENSSSKSTTQFKVFQFETEVDNTSIEQAYRSRGDVSSQKMGVEMEAYLDPWNPLHGTESAAFVRHGLYLDHDYDEGDRGATAMHLLNANLGGLAVDENLFPSHTNKNGQHLKSGETEVKNKILTLLAQDRRGYRVYYKVKFSPPAVLTPENFLDVPLTLRHTYLNHLDQPVPELMTAISDDPNQSLHDAGWQTNNSRNFRRRFREYFHEDTQGDRASSIELVEHANDPDSDAYRFHTHIAHEDKEEYL